MKKAALSAVALLSLLILSSWGYYAHHRINRMAVLALPKGMATFYKANIDFITEHAITADKRRYVDSAEIPRHFFNADRYGKAPFKTIPRKWKDFEKRYTRDTMLKHGILPWTIQQRYYWLVKAFKEHDTTSILRNSADLAHYVADAHVPLHTVLNHDGQLTGQDGIHGLWESRLPELFADKYHYPVKKAKYINNPLTEAFVICQRSFGKADSVLRLERLLNKRFPADKKYTMEKRGQRKVKVYSPEYCRAYHTLLKGMVERQMRSAMYEAASYWFSAWVDAGQPDLNKLIKKPSGVKN
ncbi:zinc dependent phospholipase C family protein [Mucilaginibacter roseus]|uniref:Zinc dependent phospholipase C family protein n=1 Tax=Mucilaginibacter roseus TaxID=1528868 RepID=A0ABS8U498_9SPHI|nr:zinc dependent phospholipase C family protein [Mucilaginibacter roseus]MCD8741921.1 zinc dependent phospholipase C family protein [Mucilaginibacter roseus]